MNENSHIDQNGRWTLTFVTNDGNQYIQNARINPVTGALLCEADVLSSNTSIGGTIPGGTMGSVLFLGPGSTLAQDNANFFYDDTNNYLGLGTNTPAATLQVDGSVQFNFGADATGDIFYRDSSGDLIQLGIGNEGDVLTVVSSLPAWAAVSPGSGYSQIQDDGVNLTQRTTLNFENYFTGSDTGGKTNISINTTELGGDSSLGTALAINTNLVNGLLANNTFITGIAGDATFLSTLDLSTISGQINLASQTTGTLGATNGGTGQSTVNQGDLLYGSALNTWSRLAKNTTAQRVLTNSGINNDPSWAQVSLTQGVSGTLPVANGGTGAASLTAYAVLCGGTTSTNPVQSIASVGTSGQVLTSNGAGALPTFQTSSSSINPLNVTWFEDFIGIVSTAVVTGQDTFIGVTQWSTQNTTAGLTMLTSVANRPGILQVVNSNANGDGIVWGALTNFYPSTTFNLEYLVKIPTANVSEEYFFGVSSGLLGASFTGIANKIGIVGTSGNWKGITANGAASTQSSGSASITGDAWVNLKITFDGTTVDFLVDNVSVGTITATLPATACGFSMLTRDVGGGANGAFEVDYAKINYQVTR